MRMLRIIHDRDIKHGIMMEQGTIQKQKTTDWRQRMALLNQLRVGMNHQN